LIIKYIYFQTFLKDYIFFFTGNWPRKTRSNCCWWLWWFQNQSQRS